MSQYNAPPSPAYPSSPVARQQNPLAVASFILACASPLAWWLFMVPVIGDQLGFIAAISPIPAIILGHIALSQIKKRGQAGRGLALAGVIIGYCLLGIGVLLAIVIFVILGMVLAGGLAFL